LTPPPIREIIHYRRIMSRGKKLSITPEEKVARKIGKELTDFTLDLEAVGKYLSVQPYIIYNRAIEILEATQYNREEKVYNDKWGEYKDDRVF
jgi:hypothetical protein